MTDLNTQDNTTTAAVITAAITNEGVEGVAATTSSFEAYDPQLTIPAVDGARIVKCLYQVNAKDGTKVQENAYIMIPTAHLSIAIVIEQAEVLAPYVLKYLQELEGVEIRGLHKKGAEEIAAGSLSLEAIIEKLEAKEAGSRLNKEAIEVWYDKEVESTVLELFLVKMGIEDVEGITEDEAGRLELVVKAYKLKFVSLASGRSSMKAADCEAMLSLLDSLEEQGTFTLRIVQRLKAAQGKEEELLAGLF